jgi:hypothetical protein
MESWYLTLAECTGSLSLSLGLRLRPRRLCGALPALPSCSSARLEGLEPPPNLVPKTSALSIELQAPMRAASAIATTQECTYGVTVRADEFAFCDFIQNSLPGSLARKLRHAGEFLVLRKMVPLHCRVMERGVAVRTRNASLETELPLLEDSIPLRFSLKLSGSISLIRDSVHCRAACPAYALIPDSRMPMIFGERFVSSTAPTLLHATDIMGHS